MRHDITLTGAAFRLRPIGGGDAAFVLQLRTDPTLNRFLHATSDSIADQLSWLSRYYERPDDYYFVVESIRSGNPEGVISVYDIERQSLQGEWGRWILRPGSLAAVESSWLIYRAAFERLGLESVYCRTVAENKPVVSFHDSCGISDRCVLPGHFEIAGRSVDAIQHRVARSSWPKLDQRLSTLAALTARRLHRV